MTLGDKKFVRYILPALQFVILLAAAGWMDALRRVLQNRPRLPTLALWALVAIQFAVSVPRHPYYGTHYNYALGGPKVILNSQIIAGQEEDEGMEDAAHYLNGMPLSKLLVVGAEPFSGFHYYFDGKTVPLTDDQVDYLVWTRNALLRGVRADQWADVWEAYRTRTPKRVIAFDGVPYVWVYKVGPVIDEADLAHPVHVRLGDSLELLGYDYEPSQVRPGETLRLTLYWEAVAAPQGDYTVFTHLLDPAGQMRAQKDNPPQGGMYPTDLWDAGERVADVYLLPIAPGAPQGEYRLAVGMYSLATMERLPVTASPGNAQHATVTPDQRILLPGPQVLAP
jgi:hypothetical protein